MVACLLPLFFLTSFPESDNVQKLHPIQTSLLISAAVWFVGSTSAVLLTSIGGAAEISNVCL